MASMTEEPARPVPAPVGAALSSTDGRSSAGQSDKRSSYWTCCRCDNPLSCASCGVEQPDDSAYYSGLVAALEKIASRHITEGPLWWQIEARNALAGRSIPVGSDKASLERVFDRLGTRLNNVLCEMKPDHDDSIVGFNEAWDVMRATFKEELERQ